MAGERILIPVARSDTLRQTVEYAVDRALDGASPEGPGAVHFVYVHSLESIDVHDVSSEPTSERNQVAETLLERAVVWAETDAGDRTDALVVETDHLGLDEYLFSPGDVARVLEDAAEAAAIDEIVFDPDYDPGLGAPFLRPLERELEHRGVATVSEAPVRRAVRRTPLLNRSTPLQLAVLFGVGFVFYQLLAGGVEAFDIVTGAVAATIVAVGLSRVSIARDPDRYTPGRILRTAIYVPYLLGQIVKANLQIAAVILHPRLPIDPRMTRIRPAVWGGLPVTTLANSITLTPGTLTVRVDGRELLVHTLVPGARADLFDGGLERAVRFVFYGRRAMRIDSLVERGEASVLGTAAAVGADAPGESADGAPDGAGGDGQ